MDVVDARYQAALKYLKGLALELDYYSGHKVLDETTESAPVPSTPVA